MSRRHPPLALLLAGLAATQLGCGPSAGMAPAAPTAGTTPATGVATAGQPGAATPATTAGTPGGATAQPGGTTPGGAAGTPGVPGGTPATGTPTTTGGSGGSGGSGGASALTFDTVTGIASIEGEPSDELLTGATVTVENALTNEAAVVGSTQDALDDDDDAIVTNVASTTTDASTGRYTVKIANLKEGSTARIKITKGAKTVSVLIDGDDPGASSYALLATHERAANTATLLLDLAARPILALAAKLGDDARAAVVSALMNQLEALRDDLEAKLDEELGADASFADDLDALAEDAATFFGNPSSSGDITTGASTLLATLGLRDEVTSAVVGGLEELVEQMGDADNVESSISNSDLTATKFIGPDVNVTTNSSNANTSLSITGSGKTVVVAATPPSTGTVTSAPNFAPEVTTFNYAGGQFDVEVTQGAGQSDIELILARIATTATLGGGAIALDASGSEVDAEALAAPLPVISVATVAGDDVNASLTLPSFFGGATLGAPDETLMLALDDATDVKFAKVQLFKSRDNYHYLAIRYLTSISVDVTALNAGHTSTLSLLKTITLNGVTSAHVAMKSKGGYYVNFPKTITTNL